MSNAMIVVRDVVYDYPASRALQDQPALLGRVTQQEIFSQAFGGEARRMDEDGATHVRLGRRRITEDESGARFVPERAGLRHVTGTQIARRGEQALTGRNTRIFGGAPQIERGGSSCRRRGRCRRMRARRR